MAKKNQDKSPGKSPKNSKVQCEGDYESARRYDKDVRDFVKTGTVEKAAEEAKKAREGSERTELERAEKVGKDKAKGFDPSSSATERSPSRPEREAASASDPPTRHRSRGRAGPPGPNGPLRRNAELVVLPIPSPCQSLAGARNALSHHEEAEMAKPDNFETIPGNLADEALDPAGLKRAASVGPVGS